MILDPELNTKNFEWCFKVAVKNAIGKRYQEEIQEIRDKLVELVNECVVEAYKDDISYKLCQEYPQAFDTTRSISIFGRELGITTKNSFPDKYEDSGVAHPYYIDSYITIELKDIRVPISRGSYRLTTKDLCEKLSPKRVEVLKSMFSEYLNKAYKLGEELHNFKSQEDSIKTVGRLYRINPVWYEDLIKSKYPELIDKLSSSPTSITAKEEEIKKEAKINKKEKNKELLEHLKEVINL